MVIYGGMQMNKLRVIDLLNKIANGEEVPKKFRYKGETYIYRTYTFEDGDIMTGYGFEDGGWLNIWRDNLNDEVEIIEEDKKVEKIPKKDKNGDIYLYSNEALEIIDKINEIIDYINKESK